MQTSPHRLKPSPLSMQTQRGALRLIASENGKVGIVQAWDVLQQGGSAIDAVETGIRFVESNAEDHSVGLGGYPNIIGEVELDAGLMDGCGMRSGAVAALKGYEHPISIARKVMEEIPHVLLVGEGAARFADEMGFAQSKLLTDAARTIWYRRLVQDFGQEQVDNIANLRDLHQKVSIATDPEHTHGTTNFIALDSNGDLCAGVSTSGWSWKFPGRVGDSPIAGAGFYADNRYGAAACTGTGEMAIRAATAHSIVMYLKFGMSVHEAGTQAMQDLNDLGGDYISQMRILVMDKDGNTAGFSSRPGVRYVRMEASSPEIQIVQRDVVEIHTRWKRD